MGVGRRDPLRVRTGSSGVPAALDSLAPHSHPCQAPAQVQTLWASPQSPCCKRPGPAQRQSTLVFLLG